MTFTIRNSILLIWLILLCQIIHGQNEPLGPSTLKEGIILEDLNLMIPWKASIEEIKNIGHPIIEKTRTNYTEARWGFVKIFGGLEISLTGYFWNPPGKSKLIHF